MPVGALPAVALTPIVPLRSDEHSRVQLPELSGDPLSAYINANYIRGWPDQARAYIATQGPLANTIVDFYRMIWQENVSVIVMITRFLERNKVSEEWEERGATKEQLDRISSRSVKGIFRRRKRNSMATTISE